MSRKREGFKLRVFMTGLCVFVLPKEKGQPVRVLMANAGTDERIKDVTGDNKIRPHKPVLQFEVANRVSDVPNYPLFQDPQGKLNGLWFLEHEELEVMGETLAGPLLKMMGPQSTNKGTRNLTPGSEMNDQEPLHEGSVPNIHSLKETPQLPGPDDDDDFFWVLPARPEYDNPTSQETLLPAGVKFLVEKLAIDQVGDDLAARFTLRGGKIEPAGFSFDSATRELFIYDIGGIEQAVASVVEWSIDIPGDSVTFRTTCFEGHAAKRKHRYLTLRPESGEEDVEVWLLNREIDEVIGQNPPVESEFEGPLRQRHEHMILCRLLQGTQELQQNTAPVRGKHPRLARDDEHFKQAHIRNQTMRRIYFPGEDGEGDHVGGPCSPVASTGG